jgi:hypothetical protein
MTACIAGLLVCGFRRCVCSLTGLSVNPRQVCVGPEPRPDAEHAYVSNVLARIYTSTYLVCQERMSAAEPSTGPGAYAATAQAPGRGTRARVPASAAADVTGLDRGGDGLKRGPDRQLELKAELLCKLAPPTELEAGQVDQPAELIPRPGAALRRSAITASTPSSPAIRSAAARKAAHRSHAGPHDLVPISHAGSAILSAPVPHTGTFADRAGAGRLSWRRGPLIHDNQVQQDLYASGKTV